MSLADEEAVREILGATVLDLWKVVNNLTRLRPSKRERYRVAIFGSARAQPGTYVYNEVKRAAAAFAAMGCDIVTGGGPGLMQAANEGAREAGAPGSVGIRVELPFEQDVNPFVEQAFEHETFFTRLQHFVIASDAFVVVPGGIGTVLEMLISNGSCSRSTMWTTYGLYHPRRQDVERARRLGEDGDARPAPGARECRGSSRFRSASTPRMKRSPLFATCTGNGRLASGVGWNRGSGSRGISSCLRRPEGPTVSANTRTTIERGCTT